MELTAASASAITQNATASEISMRVAKKALDASKAQGDAAVSLIEAAAKIQKQQRNYAVAQGGNLDVTA